MELPESLKNCTCGRKHVKTDTAVFCEEGALKRLPEAVMMCGAKKAFVVCDKNTYKAAGEKAASILKENGVPFELFIFAKETLKPDESTVGSLFMHFKQDCDVIVGVGSGVINDSCKILSKRTGRKYIICATAPSMDGYCSATSSMEVDGLKLSLDSRSADIIIGDIDILRNAPEHMLRSGLGDMIAKYVSICDWRISNLINGEYYCEAIADVVRQAVNKCTSNMSGLLKRDSEAVRAVFEGLLLTGAAMNWAGASRPASGIEHYFSHIWDMRALEFGTPSDFHGIQCGIGTYYSCRIYNVLKNTVPDRDKALAPKKFDYAEWSEELRKFLGKSADTVIALESKEQKYDEEKRIKRAKTILDKWPEILKIIGEEIPSDERILEILNTIKAPVRVGDIGLPDDVLKMTFLATKDIRDKYILSRLCFDLGIEEEIAGMIMNN